MQAVIPDAQHVGQQLASVRTSGCFLPFSFNSIIFRYLRAPLGWAIQLRGSLIQQDQGHFPVSSTARPSSNLDPTLFAAGAEKHETRWTAESNQGICDKVLHVARNIALNLVENILLGTEIWKQKVF